MRDSSVTALEVRALSKAFGGVHAVQDVSFGVAQGSLTALIGPNGAGKSTLFNLLTNLYSADRGSTFLFGESVARKTSNAIARLGMIRTFQTARAFPGMSVLENVLAGGHLRTRHGVWQQAFRTRGVRREEAALADAARGLLQLIHLEHALEASALSLPLGSQKLLEVVRALMARPRVLLLDEPAAGLNDAETDELGKLLRAICDTGTTVIVVEHNMSLVMDIADEVLVLDGGRLIARGTPAQIQANDQVIEAYVGRPLESA